MDELIGQFALFAIFVTAESYLGTRITKDVCDYINKPWNHVLIAPTDWAFFFGAIGLFGFVVWLREKVKFPFAWVLLSSLLVVVLVCLGVWGSPDSM